MMNNTQHTGKVKAARNLAGSIANAFDVEIWMDGHPNEDRAWENLMRDIEEDHEENDAEPFDGLS